MNYVAPLIQYVLKPPWETQVTHIHAQLYLWTVLSYPIHNR